MEYPTVQNPPRWRDPRNEELQTQPRAFTAALGLSSLLEGARSILFREDDEDAPQTEPAIAVEGPSERAQEYALGLWRRDLDTQLRRNLIFDGMNNPKFKKMIDARRKRKDDFEKYITGRS